MPGFRSVLRPQTAGDQRRRARADHIRNGNGDHHDRVGQIDRRQLIIVPHQPYKVRVHHIIEHHDEHACNQRYPQLHHGQGRFLPAQNVDPPVLFLIVFFSILSRRICLLRFWQIRIVPRPCFTRFFL